MKDKLDWYGVAAFVYNEQAAVVHPELYNKATIQLSLHPVGGDDNILNAFSQGEQDTILLFNNSKATPYEFGV